MIAAKQSVLTPPPTTSANETQDLKTGDNERGGVEEEEEWQEVGPKNKSTITRQVIHVHVHVLCVCVCVCVCVCA